MNGSPWFRCLLVGLAVGLLGLNGCPGPRDTSESGRPGGKDAAGEDQPSTDTVDDAAAESQPVSTANPEDVQAAKTLLDDMGTTAEYTLLGGDVITRIVIRDGSTLTPEDLQLFGRLSDLETIHILNYRDLNDDIAAHLAGLENLTDLALTNSVITDATVELIVKSFPELTYLDLSSNPNMSNGALKIICQLAELQRLFLVQNQFNDLGTGHLTKLENLRVLDLRGNMQAGDMTMEVLGQLPKLTVLKHRSSTVSDYGMECLSESETLESLLMQDFKDITNEAGSYLADLSELAELEIFRCQQFGSDGVLALKGKGLTRLKLRDLPAVDDQGMAVFQELPELRRLYLHENDSISDEGLANLAGLKKLEILDIWSIPQMTDATVDVIVGLPNLEELSIRTTNVTDAAVDKILTMPKLHSLTLKENAAVTDEALQKLTDKEWIKLDIGSSSAAP